MNANNRGLRAALVIVILATIVAPPLAGQTRVERLRAAYSVEDAATIEALIGEAADQGLPTDALYDKALEGAAKRMPTARVLPALEAFRGRMQSARSLMEGAPSASAIVAGSDAILRGVPPETIRELGRSGTDRTAVALLVAGDLAESGITGDRALQVIREALNRTRDEAGLLEVPATLRRLVREGAVPRDAVDRMLRALRDGRPLHRVRHRPGGRDLLDAVRRRPVPPGSDPTRDRSGSGGGG